MTRICAFQFPEQPVAEAVANRVAEMIAVNIVHREVIAMCGYVGGNSHMFAKLSNLAPTIGSSPLCQHLSSRNTAPAARSSGSKKSSTTSPPQCTLVCSKLQWLLFDAYGTKIKHKQSLDTAPTLHSWQCQSSWYDFIDANSRIEGTSMNCRICPYGSHKCELDPAGVQLPEIAHSVYGCEFKFWPALPNYRTSGCQPIQVVMERQDCVLQ